MYIKYISHIGHLQLKYLIKISVIVYWMKQTFQHLKKLGIMFSICLV